MKFVFTQLRRLNDLLAKLATALAVAITGIMVLALSASAATRFLSGTGYDWLIELPPALVPWLVFPLLGPLLRSGLHIQVDLAPTLLSPGIWRVVKFANSLIVLAGAIVFFLAGQEATALFRMLGQMMELEIEIPIWWMYLAFPVGFGMLILFALEAVLEAGRDLFARSFERVRS